jgi:hypothetical protein
MKFSHPHKLPLIQGDGYNMHKYRNNMYNYQFRRNYLVRNPISHRIYSHHNSNAHRNLGPQDTRRRWICHSYYIPQIESLFFLLRILRIFPWKPLIRGVYIFYHTSEDNARIGKPASY